jgi:transposase
MTGRPTKLTPDLTKKIVGVIAAGNYLETAAAYAGLSKVTLYDWMKRGRRELERRNNGEKANRRESHYVTFLNAIEKALAQSEAGAVATITKASEDHWQAAAWRLERRFPNKWARRDHHHISGDDVEPEHKSLLDVLLVANDNDES